MRRGKKGQIWVETVIYTLIGLAIIGILLAVIRPKITAINDKIIIENEIESLNRIDEKIKSILSAPGNQRSLDLKISKGTLTIDAVNEIIKWTFDESGYEFSQSGEPVPIGKINALTTGSGPWNIELSIDYSIFDLKYNGKDIEKNIESAPSLYTIYIQNNGTILSADNEKKIFINIKVE